jgi:competence protein ComEC
LQLSYGGTVGIIFFYKEILNILKNINIKNKIYKYQIKPKVQKILDKIKEIIAISISVQINIFPIMVYQLNTFNPYFLISNLLVSVIIEPIIIIGVLLLIITNINLRISKFISLFLELLIEILVKVSKISELNFSKIYIPTPSILGMVIYWFLIVILIQIYKIYSSKNPNRTQIRIRNIIAFMKYKTRLNKNKCKQILAGMIIVFVIINFIPRDLKIHFIDVGQGDSTLIITPSQKTILIDGGGNFDFDVGKNTLVPYILNRGFSKIDMVIISHLDYDHVRTGYLQLCKN